MKFLVVLAVAVACAHADVSHVVGSPDAAAQVLNYESEIGPSGDFSYNYAINNGISASAKGVLKNVNAENPALEVIGEYSYTGNDGNVYTVKYVSNDKGYQPTGDHLPVPPPIPEAILRAIEYNAAHPQDENKNENYQRVVTPVQNYKPAQVAYKPGQKKF